MFRRQPVVAILVLGLIAGCAAPAASPRATTSGTPTASLPSPTASSSLPSTTAPTPPSTPSPTLTPATPEPTVAPPKPSQTPTTMIVRAYFLLEDTTGEDAVLVPVLRTVPKIPATATAAMKALLAGPSAKEQAAQPRIETLIPAGSKLLGVNISRGLATVNLSSEFASVSPDDAWDSGSFSLRGRLAQVVYTLTQFSTVN